MRTIQDLTDSVVATMREYGWEVTATRVSPEFIKVEMTGDGKPGQITAKFYYEETVTT